MQNYNVYVISPSTVFFSECILHSFHAFPVQQTVLIFYCALKLGTNVSCAFKFTAHDRHWFYNSQSLN